MQARLRRTPEQWYAYAEARAPRERDLITDVIAGIHRARRFPETSRSGAQEDLDGPPGVHRPISLCGVVEG